MNEWLMIKVLAGGLLYAVVGVLVLLQKFRNVSESLHKAKEDYYQLKLTSLRRE